ncbi:MAG: hypothetical protein KJO82_12045 [Gammaproteobacteria bacterium]|nr:hypothetical protein [Gammaproteobacteria bacterium]NNC77541.1 hypothetical protein [Woeseiaceae bacterium]
MSATRSVLFVLLPLLLVACHAGLQIEELTAARTPEGAFVTLEFNRASPLRALELRRVELLEVQQGGMLISATTGTDSRARLAFVSWDELKRVSAVDFKGMRWAAGHTEKYDSSHKNKLRLISRYPQGLSETLREQLAATFGQPGVETLSP